MALGAHVAALGLSFPTQGTLVPRGDAVVTLHGSWNRRERAGYKVVRVPSATGSRRANSSTSSPGGRCQTATSGADRSASDRRGDGSILIVDDGARTIWRLHRGA